MLTLVGTRVAAQDTTGVELQAGLWQCGQQRDL